MGEELPAAARRLSLDLVARDRSLLRHSGALALPAASPYVLNKTLNTYGLAAGSAKAPPSPDVTPADITIAVTVYSRAEFIFDAIRSALEQTVPVKVIVVEDCGPNPKLQSMVRERFGERITYFRNPTNRGLFDNWNACMEYCTTAWLSILHDDDMLAPRFVETMLALHQKAPDCSIYFGRTSVLAGQEEERTGPVTWKEGWRPLPLAEFAELNVVLFPGQLLRVADAHAVGGFRPISLWAGDWDFWFRMAVHGGAAQTAEEVSVARSHYGADRGTSRVERMGWKWALDNVQRKRNLALLAKARGIHVAYDRTRVVKSSPVPTVYLLRYARGFSRRMLKYDYWLYLKSVPPNLGYAIVQSFLRLIGPRGVKLISSCWNLISSSGQRASK